MDRRAAGWAGTFLGACVATPLVLGLLLGGSAAAQDTTTTTVPATTTTATTLPASTTTAPTTTTTLPATTTTRARPTTTTSHASTTTTTAAPTTTTTAAKASSSSEVWGWVLLAAAVALAAILVGSLIARNRRQARAVDWRRSVVPAVTAAELARELVGSLTPTDDAQRRAEVGVQVDQAATALERAAAAAPDEESRALCSRCGEDLRGLAFAVEADHLLRTGGGHPTADQLAAADAARRNRSAELDAALQELRAEVTSAPGAR